MVKKTKKLLSFPCTFSMRSMPEDVYKIIATQAAHIKKQRGVSQYSLELTLYHIVKDWKNCRGGKDIEI